MKNNLKYVSNKGQKEKLNSSVEDTNLALSLLNVAQKRLHPFVLDGDTILDETADVSTAIQYARSYLTNVLRLYGVYTAVDTSDKSYELREEEFEQLTRCIAEHQTIMEAVNQVCCACYYENDEESLDEFQIRVSKAFLAIRNTKKGEKKND